MILIFTHKTDFTADFLIHQLNERGKVYYRFNCEDIISTPYQFSKQTDFSFALNQEQKFSSVWYRRTRLPTLPDELTTEERTYLLGEYEGLLSNILYSVSSPCWLSHPAAIHRAEHKTLQLQQAQALGFNVPSTIITNVAQDIRSFASLHQGKVVIKPLRSGRLTVAGDTKFFYTAPFTKTTVDQLEDFDLTPCIIQQNIDKQYELRVTVVGEQVFAAKVDSQGNERTITDWRKQKLPFSAYLLPDTISDLCVRLVKAFDLHFGAIDLIRTKSGDYVFLEINPNGQWAWVEIDTGLPISSSIIEFLTTPI